MKKDYTKFSESSKETVNKEKDLGEVMIDGFKKGLETNIENDKIETTDVNIVTETSNLTELKSLEDCTIDELLGVVDKENIAIVEGATKEELISAILYAGNPALENTRIKFINSKSEDTTNKKIEEDIMTGSNIKEAGVTNCTRLNVRKEPSKESEIACVIDNTAEVTVDLMQSTEDFYKVYIYMNETSYDGYCMKQFIDIE